jgi:hypothetical protein
MKITKKEIISKKGISFFGQKKQKIKISKFDFCDKIKNYQKWKTFPTVRKKFPQLECKFPHLD